MIIQRNSRAWCSSCTNPASYAYLQPIHIYLDEVKSFVDEFKGIGGYEDVIKQMKYNAELKVEANAYLLRIIKEKGLVKADVDYFEFKYAYPDNFAADIVTNGVLQDCKSWGKYFIDMMPGKEPTSQIKAYIKNPPFEMWFDFKKMEIAGFDKISAENYIKEQYQLQLTNLSYAEDLFKANENYFIENFGINTFNILKTKADLGELIGLGVLDFVKVP